MVKVKESGQIKIKPGSTLHFYLHQESGLTFFRVIDTEDNVVLWDFGDDKQIITELVSNDGEAGKLANLLATIVGLRIVSCKTPTPNNWYFKLSS